MPVVVGSRWVVLVPVKRLAVAKTRLRGAFPGIPLDRLVLAMAEDTIAAALACPRVRQVLVITNDPLVTPALETLGAGCVPDEPAGGLNAALAHGARRAATMTAGAEAVVALTADLPALRPAELSAALEAAERLSERPPGPSPERVEPGRAYVPDAGGTGTVLLAALGGAPLLPRFGDGSAAAHAASGALRLDGDWATLRRDVDTAADLDAAIALGLGDHTAAAVAAARYGGLT